MISLWTTRKVILLNYFFILGKISLSSRADAWLLVELLFMMIIISFSFAGHQRDATVVCLHVSHSHQHHPVAWPSPYLFPSYGSSVVSCTLFIEWLLLRLTPKKYCKHRSTGPRSSPICNSLPTNKSGSLNTQNPLYLCQSQEWN